ncbi:hypothetical protein ACF1A5_11625 [Streptomyces sp. NPDC014864]|uniref:hypothetical protein n=1 Tax=Streptomyces sp. NPDC014864 TaxID=3364924 RepID=UPI0036F68E3D
MSRSRTHHRPHRRAPRAALAALVTLALAGTLGGCSSGSRGAPPAPSSSGRPAPSAPSSASSVPAASPSASPSASAAPSPGPVVLGERARGTTVHVVIGTLVEVRLRGGYWSAPEGSDPRVLAPTGGGAGPTPAPTCPPGRSCGASSARFTAVRTGTVRVTARRTSCGEAMRCPPGQDRFEVTVVVTR